MFCESENILFCLGYGSINFVCVTVKNEYVFNVLYVVSVTDAWHTALCTYCLSLVSVKTVYVALFKAELFRYSSVVVLISVNSVVVSVSTRNTWYCRVWSFFFSEQNFT